MTFIFIPDAFSYLAIFCFCAGGFAGLFFAARAAWAAAALDSLVDGGFLFFLWMVESLLFDFGVLFDAAGLFAGGVDGSLSAAGP